MTDRRVAIVSGGTRGLGRAVTERLLADGWWVLATYLNDVANAEALAASHIQLAVRRADSSSTDQCNRAVAEAIERFGQLDHLVSAAGFSRNGAVRDLSDADWEETVATNLTGPFRLARAAIPFITLSQRGRIVTVSSVAALMGNAGQGAYAASKAGLLGFTKTLARELAPDGTTVNLVIPGPTADTGMTVDTDPQFIEAITRRIPLKRLGRPEETAHAVRSLLDDLAAFTTGTAIVVDGGLSM